MNQTVRILSILFVGLLTSCAVLDPERVDRQQLENSYLESVQGLRDANSSADATTNSQTANGNNWQRIEALNVEDQLMGDTLDLAKRFKSSESLQLALDELPLQQFLHYALGDVLKVSYILDEQTNKDNKPVTLNIKDRISPRGLFILLEDVLLQRGYVISLKNDIYYIVASKQKRGNVNNVFGIGANAADVPNTSRNIVQIVPLKFGLKSSLNQLLTQVVDVVANPDLEQSALFLRGKRENILKALEFISMVDTPSLSSRYIGVVSLSFVTPEEFITQATDLMKNEGIPVADSSAASGASIVFVPIKSSGAVAIFAKTEAFLNRAQFWGEMIDKPQQSNDKRYYVYHPKFARAMDLGESLKPLLGNSVSVAANQNSNQQGQNTSASAARRGNDNARLQSSNRGLSDSDVNMIVDERSNVLVFYANGSEYQSLLPLIRRLDVMPKQIMMDVMIAEVSLQDEFKKGVEFLLNETTDSGATRQLSTQGAFGVGGGLTYSWVGSDRSVNLSLFQDNSLVNIISQPTILVRDGVDAQISVGTDIPVVGATTSDPINGQRETTQVDYRKTGVELSVAPTVNAQGVLIMDIDLKISNTIDSGVTTAGSPSIFERAIKTEVVADSGQTVILGGLISENATDGVTKVPVLGDIPILGHLFRGDSVSKDKTELVVLVTPRVIHRQEEWDELKRAFDLKLQHLKLE